MKNKKLIYTVGLSIFLLDQLIKLIVIKNMELLEEIKIIRNFFSLYYVKNTGAAFSIFGNKTFFLILVSIISLLFLKYYIKKIDKVNTLSIISLGMVIGGILGNLFDRLIYKAVIDYLAFDIFTYAFPVFNLADICITIGTLLTIIDIIIEEKRNKASKWFGVFLL